MALDTAPNPVRAAKREAAAYRHGEHRPLGAYAGIMAANASLLAAAAVAFKKSGKGPPAPLSAGDVVLTSIATHRIARLVSKDTITSPLRAPFARYEGPGAPAEVNEEVRGRGWRKAIGELVTCPFCTGEWIATSFAVGWLFAPRATRFIATMWGCLGIADAMQFGYAALEKASK
ncbi:MAG: DUF1360 domain-containing protein [Actinomycetota bacterium]|nr:DUF1360 domain-containing protein [Actinomycetota bacterium]